MKQGWSLLLMLVGVMLSVAVHLSWGEPPTEPPARLIALVPAPEVSPQTVVPDPRSPELGASIGGLHAQAYGIDGGGLSIGYTAGVRSALGGFGGGGTASGLGGGPHSRPVVPTTAINASVESAEPIVLGALDTSIVQRIVRQHTPQLRYCYQKALQKDPALFGQVVEKVVIAKDGSVSSAAAKRTTMEDEALQQCIDGRFMRMRFPKPKGGGIVIVSYPLIFKPQLTIR